MPLITVSRYESAEGRHYVIRRAGVNTELHLGEREWHELTAQISRIEADDAGAPTGAH